MKKGANITMARRPPRIFPSVAEYSPRKDGLVASPPRATPEPKDPSLSSHDRPLAINDHQLLVNHRGLVLEHSNSGIEQRAEQATAAEAHPGMVHPLTGQQDADRDPIAGALDERRNERRVRHKIRRGQSNLVRRAFEKGGADAPERSTSVSGREKNLPRRGKTPPSESTALPRLNASAAAG